MHAFPNRGRTGYKQLSLGTLLALCMLSMLVKEANPWTGTHSLIYYDLQDGYSDYEKAAEKAASWLLSWQNDDGGWPSSIHTTQKHPSYPQSTAEAFLALLDYGIPIDSTPVIEAISYLLNVNLEEQKREAVSIICHALAKAGHYTEQIIAKLNEIETRQMQILTQKTEFDIDANYHEILAIYSAGFIMSGSWPYEKREAVEWFSELQNGDGSFGDFSLDFDKRICMTAKYIEILAVFDNTTVDTFLRGISFLKSSQNDEGSWGSPAYAHKTTCQVLRALLKSENSSSENIARGLEWLILNQFPDGSWGIGILNRYIDWVSFALSVICESISLDLNRSISLGTNFLKRFQSLDGSWGDAYETCKVLNLLADLGESLESPTIRKAVNWLLSNQSTDGTWEYHTSLVVSTLLKVGVNPEVEEIKKAMVFLRQNLDDFYYGPRNIATLLEAGESFNSKAIQETLALIKICQEPDGSFTYRAYPEKVWKVFHTYETVSFLLRIGTDPQSDTIKDAISYLLDEQESNGSWLDSPEETFEVCSTLVMAGFNASHPALQQAKNWTLDFLETDDFDWDYHLLDTVSIFSLIDDNSGYLERIEAEILKEQRTESNLREIRKEYAAENIVCSPDCGWPSEWTADSEVAWWGSVYGTCNALKSLCIIRDGLETPGSKPFLSVVVYLSDEMIVKKPYTCIVKVTSIDRSVNLSIEVESADFAIDPQSTAGIFSKQKEQNLTFRITPLTEGTHTLRVSTLYNGTLLDKKILFVTIREITIFNVIEQVAPISVLVFLLYWIILGSVPILEYRLAKKHAGIVPFTGVTLSLLAFHFTLLSYVSNRLLITKPAYLQYLALTTACSSGVGIVIYLLTLKYNARINDAIDALIRGLRIFLSRHS